MKPGISLPVTNCAGANGFQWEIESIEDCTPAICACLVVFEFRSAPWLGNHRLERSRCYRLEGRTSRREVAPTRSYPCHTTPWHILKIWCPEYTSHFQFSAFWFISIFIDLVLLIMCGCFGNMCTCIYCVLYCLYCVCIVSFMYIYSYLFWPCLCKDYCHRMTTQLQLVIIIIIIIISADRNVVQKDAEKKLK